jgi:hypothetical protein
MTTVPNGLAQWLMQCNISISPNFPLFLSLPKKISTYTVGYIWHFTPFFVTLALPKLPHSA